MSEFSQLLVRELPLIEKITHVICRRSGMQPDEIEEFTAEVRLKLVKNDYAILRAYAKRSSFSTYMAAVIQRLLIDYRRHHLGKWHDSAEAQRLGPVAIDVERAILRDGRTPEETLTSLRGKHPQITAAEIERIASALPARIRHKRVPIEQAEAIESSGETDRVARADIAARISAV
ncbi:MAG TPA: hypothetical protein VF911_09075, partial [Thermoanaerobaculia bacterium]